MLHLPKSNLDQEVSQALLNWVGRMVGPNDHHLHRKHVRYYFCRRVPMALLKYNPKPRVVVILKARQYRDALMQTA